MFEIRKNVPKPDVPKRPSTASKYPFAHMEVGDFFVVPKTEMLESDTPQKFRNRVQKSARNFALRTQTDELRKEYTVELMPTDAEGDDPEWLAGDVGVWCDK